VPTVVVGLGKPGVMLSVLGKKIGAPWTYAALEHGMETHPDQPTVSDLRTVYHYDAISRSTRLIGVTGFGERERATVAGLNAAFAHLDLPARCLPLGVGSVRLFRKVVDAVKVAAVVVDEEHRRPMLEMVTERDEATVQARATDLILHKGEKWHGYNTQHRATLAALEAALRTKTPGDQPLQGRVVMVVGVNDLARTLAAEVKQRGGVVIVASHARKAAQELAQALECRFVQFEALYSTMHDVLLVCDDEAEPAKAGKPAVAGLHPGYLKPGMTVLDLTTPTKKTPLVREAELRGCGVVTPHALLLDQIETQARLITGKDVPREVLAAAVPPPEE
jgi:shikimate 5-dehydrogenase